MKNEGSFESIITRHIVNDSFDSECPDISLVILCYKTGDKIYNFLNRAIKSLESVTANWEIILVGNYWPATDDATPKIVKEIASSNPKIQAVTKPKEGGMGWDARSGFDLCRGKIVALIDGDEQMVAEDIAKGYQILTSKEVDLVKTFRQQRHDPWIRRINSLIYNIIYNAIFPGYFVQDVNSKPKILRKSALEQMGLRSNDWFLDAEMMIRARRLQLKFIEFPTIFLRSIHRKSFVRISAIFEFLKNLIVARFQEFFRLPPQMTKTQAPINPPVEVVN